MPCLLFQTAFGTCAVAWQSRGITRFQLPEEGKERASARVKSLGGDEVPEAEAPEWIRSVVERARLHLAGNVQDLSDANLDWSLVSDFQAAVYRQALGIRPGHERAYGDLARAIGLGPESARAVGVALATNPWPLLVPCHRVVSARGRMTGFSAPGGIRTKTRLLALEGAELLSE